MNKMKYVDPAEVFELTYEIEGSTKNAHAEFDLFTMSISFKDFVETFKEQGAPKEQIPEIIRQHTREVMVLWATYQIDKRKFIRDQKLYSKEHVNLVKRALKSKHCNEDMHLVLQSIAAYIFLKYQNKFEDETGNKLHVFDCENTQDRMNILKDTWQDQPIAQRGKQGINSYEELVNVMKAGYLKYKWSE